MDSEWHRICTESTMFALKHGIKADFPDEHQRHKKRMCGEKGTDESLCGQKRFKVETFITALDEMLQQF